MLYLKGHLSCLVCLWRELIVQFTAYHQFDDFFCGQLLCRLRGYPGTVAHNCYFIRNTQDFCHLMGNVNNAAALVTKHIDDIKEVLYLLLRKG